jgi:DNA polymerase-3 subunit beta
MQNIFGEEMKHEKPEKKQVVVDPVNAFLDAASHMELSKNSLSICSYIAKNENKLLATNIKSFLVMPYNGNEENGIYEYTLSKAFKKLDGFNTNNNTLEKFPQTEIDITGEWVDINSVQSQLMLDAFRFVSDDETKYFMNGIYFDEGNVVSTDGRRLFSSQGFDKFPAVILPNSKMLEWLLKKGANIKYKIDKAFYVFQFEYKGNVFYYCTTNIEGQFPNWRKVVPEKQTYTINILDIIAWKDIYSKTMQLKNKDTMERIIIKHDKDDMVIVEWENKTMGTMQWKGFYDNDRIENENKCWKHIEDTIENPRKPFVSLLTSLAINYKYLNDALTLKELKEIQFTSFVKAITFIYKDGSNHIIMPMQLD